MKVIASLNFGIKVPNYIIAYNGLLRGVIYQYIVDIWNRGDICLKALTWSRTTDSLSDEDCKQIDHTLIAVYITKTL